LKASSTSSSMRTWSIIASATTATPFPFPLPGTPISLRARFRVSLHEVRLVIIVGDNGGDAHLGHVNHLAQGLDEYLRESVVDLPLRLGFAQERLLERHAPLSREGARPLPSLVREKSLHERFIVGEKLSWQTRKCGRGNQAGDGVQSRLFEQCHGLVGQQGVGVGSVRGSKSGVGGAMYLYSGS